MLLACQTPADKIDDIAEALGMAADVVGGEGYTHRIYFKASDSPQYDTLQIYIEGDGRPWRYGRQVSNDPTPARPVAMHLLASDHEGGVYLGRPCYFESPRSKGCQPEDWTSGRYSDAVVESLVVATRTLQRRYGAHKLRLIGYSGGGSLAILMADRLENVELVVTVAANLDISAWTRLHGYLPLEKSLNPVVSALHRGCAVHISGDRDQNVPGDLVQSYVNHRGGVHLRAKGQDHSCCWQNEWPELLAEAEAVARQAGCI